MTIDEYSELRLRYDALLTERGEIIDKYNTAESNLANINQQIAEHEAELLNMLDDMRTEIQPDMDASGVDITHLISEPLKSVGGSAISENATEESEDDLIPESEPEE